MIESCMKDRITWNRMNLLWVVSATGTFLVFTIFPTVNGLGEVAIPTFDMRIQHNLHCNFRNNFCCAGWLLVFGISMFLDRSVSFLRPS
jgi:hypothetical protein